MAYPNRQFRAPNNNSRSSPSMTLNRHENTPDGDSPKGQPNKQGYNSPSNNKHSPEPEVPFISKKEMEKKNNEVDVLKKIENNLETYLSEANPTFMSSTSKTASTYDPENFNRHIPGSPYREHFSPSEANMKLSREELSHKLNDLSIELSNLERMLQIEPHQNPHYDF